MTGANYAIAIVMGISCFLVVTGAAMPWVTADTGFGTVAVSGLSGEIKSVGTWSLIPGLIVAALLVLTLIMKRWHLLVKIALILFSLIVALVGITFTFALAAEGEGGVGMGLWMTMWGGLGMLVASIWGSVKWNSAIDNSP